MVGKPDLADELFFLNVFHTGKIFMPQSEKVLALVLYGACLESVLVLWLLPHTRGCVEDDDEEGCVCYVWVPTTLWP